MPKCIYCLQEKDKKRFNTEHVVAQSFGIYDGNAAVLHKCEVCTECNTIFNQKFENVINLDSIETVERMRFGKPMDNDTKQLKKRTKVQIASGILEGLDVTPTVNNQTKERMFLAYSDFVGIRKMQEEKNRLLHFTPMSIVFPEDNLRGKHSGLVNHGIKITFLLHLFSNKQWWAF